eukprot:TRINITY_DN2387_c0_g2_i1.p1 TRINITY_DN2387_c0_g2~~TRINITY_DN2387_c0_g2_i1.p1  ORF type:complete len:214 (+),score=27.94 TRINITY_DN2387_c0_g2_i1:116-757(+)
MSGLTEYDICDYLVGSWKRNLEWRHFGGSFPHLRTSNTIVVIEEYQTPAKEPNSRYLKWSFGKSLEKDELRFGYVMKFCRNPSNEETQMQWQYAGESCSGVYQAATGAAVLHFALKSSTVIITYRIVDPSTMSVCIVEVDQQHTPTIQYGNMCRIDVGRYCAANDELMYTPAFPLPSPSSDPNLDLTDSASDTDTQFARDGERPERKTISFQS